MQQSLLLKKYKYAIPPSCVALSSLHKRNYKAKEKQLHMLRVFLDFENGILRIEGDWCFMMKDSKDYEFSWRNHRYDRVLIEAVLYPSRSIDLNDERLHELAMSLEGYIDDGQSMVRCIGLLTVSKVRDSISSRWEITSHLIDREGDDLELEFKLPVFGNSLQESKNN